jgi:hypothetical protein
MSNVTELTEVLWVAVKDARRACVSSRALLTQTAALLEAGSRERAEERAVQLKLPMDLSGHTHR